MNEKLNFPLLFPIDDKVFRNRKSLWKVLNENIKNRKITELYRANNDQFLPETLIFIIESFVVGVTFHPDDGFLKIPPFLEVTIVLSATP